MNLLDCLYLPAALLTAPWWARKTRGGWAERFGNAAALPPKRADRPRVMLHAVSVGEVNALRSLTPMLVEDGAEVVVSVTTDTGIARARQLWSEQSGVYVVRYPLDFSHAVARFLDAVEPDAVGLVELELWPNFVKACARRGVPVGVVNGRLSARSFANYAKVRRLLRPMFSSLAFAAVQDEAYAQRFRHMGVASEKVFVTGSMKWDAVRVRAGDEDVGARACELARELGIDRARPLVVAGSTGPLGEKNGSAHRGEEGLIDAAVGAASVDARLLCGPRKPERFDEAFRALGGEGRCVRRSRVHAAAGTGETPAPRDRFLLDTIGELAAAYELADVVVIGRSFGELHGSDPIEPIALGKPVVIGPRFGDFQSIVETFQEAGGIVVLPDARETTLAGALKELLEFPARRAELARRGVECVRANQGATRRHAELLLQLIALRR